MFEGFKSSWKAQIFVLCNIIYHPRDFGVLMVSVKQLSFFWECRLLKPLKLELQLKGCLGTICWLSFCTGPIFLPLNPEFNCFCERRIPGVVLFWIFEFWWKEWDQSIKKARWAAGFQAASCWEPSQRLPSPLLSALVFTCRFLLL